MTLDKNYKTYVQENYYIKGFSSLGIFDKKNSESVTNDSND